ncbi:MAG: ATP-binding protein [Treponema sp.]|nr:ATP-binding protein [Treponema sp.]
MSRLPEHRMVYTDAIYKSLEIFVSYTEKAINDVMSNGLRPVADAAGLDRIIVFRVFGVESETAGEIYRWNREEGGTAPLDNSLKILPLIPPLKRWISVVSKDACISLKRSEFTDDESAFLSPRGVKSILIVPVFIEREFWGVVTFHDNTAERDFDGDCTNLLRSAARLCVSTLIRAEMEREAASKTKLLYALNSISAIMLKSDSSSFEKDLLHSMGIMAGTAGADRVYIWKNYTKEEKLYCSQIYEWSEGAESQQNYELAIETSYSDIVPGWEDLLSQGKCINGIVREMSENEKAALVPQGIVSILAVPVLLQNRFWGFVGFDDCHNERVFSENEEMILRSASQLFVNALIRTEMEGEITKAEVLKRTREADERTQIIFDTTPIGSCMFDKDFKIFDCNQEIVRMFGLPNKQIFLERFFEFSPEYQPCGKKSPELAAEIISKAFSEGYNRFEWMHRTLSGELIPCEIINVRVKYKDEYVIAGYIRDLSEHKALLNEIHNENERYKTMAHWYESLLDAIPFLVTAQDLNRNCTFINAIAETSFGKRRDDIVGKPCSNLGFSICNTENCARECMERGRMRTHFIHNNDSYQVDTKPLKDLDGCTTGYIEVIQDITKMEYLSKQQAEAEAASSAKTSFLSVMSHEMRTPMNAIIGMAAIGKNTADLERKNYALNKIEDASTHLLGIINNVLDMSKIEANKLELSYVTFDLRKILQKVISFLQFSIEKKRIRFSLNVDENTPSLLIGDEQRVTQIIINLLSNAVKFTHEDGSIRLNVVFAGKEGKICELRFEVNDSGIGISPEQHEKIFHAFEQAESGTTRKFGGTGLGLGITKRLIELMGGRIWVESELGKGAKFIFTIKMLCDIKDYFPQSGEDPWSEQTLPDGSGFKDRDNVFIEDLYGKLKDKKLLIVEDIDINREILISLLDGTGLIVDTAENGKEALEMMIANPEKYDLVFMDMQMPVMDGLEATKRIRAFEKQHTAENEPLPERPKNIPIVAMTANVFQEDIEKCHAAGMDDHIGKPLDIVKVLEKLNKYL